MSVANFGFFFNTRFAVLTNALDFISGLFMTKSSLLYPVAFQEIIYLVDIPCVRKEQVLKSPDGGVPLYDDEQYQSETPVHPATGDRLLPIIR